MELYLESNMAADLCYPTVEFRGNSTIYGIEDEWGNIKAKCSKPRGVDSLYRDITEASKTLDRYMAKEYILATKYNSTDTTSTSLYSLCGMDYTDNITATSALKYYLESDTVRSTKWARDGWVEVPIDPTARMRELIRARQAPLIVTPRCRVAHPEDIREFRARETLRRMIGEKAFQDYLKKGFTSVRAKSGRVYQIFPGHKMTTVWENGLAIQKLCVVLTSGFAPTDSVIMRYILVLTDEADFWARSNKSAAYPDKPIQTTIDFRPLPEIFAELKAKRAA